jgi:hypothetical protein
MADSTEKNAEIGRKIANAFVARQNPAVNARSMLSDPALWAEIAGILAGDVEVAEAAPEEAPAEAEEDDAPKGRRGKR